MSFMSRIAQSKEVNAYIVSSTSVEEMGERFFLVTVPNHIKVAAKHMDKSTASMIHRHGTVIDWGMGEPTEDKVNRLLAKHRLNAA